MVPSLERASNCSDTKGEASKRAGCDFTVASVAALSSDHMIELGVRKSVKEKETLVPKCSAWLMPTLPFSGSATGFSDQPPSPRSEERRVGKECRSRWS